MSLNLCFAVSFIDLYIYIYAHTLYEIHSVLFSVANGFICTSFCQSTTMIINTEVLCNGLLNIFSEALSADEFST